MTKSELEKGQHDVSQEEKEKSSPNFVRGGPLPPDDPIYTSGYVLLRPIHGKAKHSSGEPEDVTEETESLGSKD